MKIEKLKVHIPFKENFIFFLFVLIFLLQAYMHNNNIAYIFIFFILGIIANNYFLLKKNLKGIEFYYVGCDNQFANETTNIYIRVENPSNIYRYDIRINGEVSISIPPMGKKAIIIKEIYNKRGKHRIPILHITSAFPLYIFDQYYCDLDLDKEIVIYPKKQGEGLDSFYESSLGFFGEKDDFKGLRKYMQNDSLSQIHWKSLAKGALMSKEYNYLEQQRSFVFDYDRLQGFMEKKLSQITLWVVEADKKSCSYSVILSSKRYESSKYSLKEILTALALYR